MNEDFDFNVMQGIPPETSEDRLNNLYHDTLKEEKITNIISQLNPDNLLSDIEFRLRGYKKNRFTGTWEKLKGHKEISEILISRFISFLGGILNDNTRFSNYSAGEINNVMGEIIGFVKDDLSDNDEEYGIVGDYDEMTRIGHIICINTFSVLKRALNGMESRRIFATLRVTENVNPQQQKKGIMDALQFWK